MIVLGIETSCDETAVAIVDNKKNILANIVSSQIDIHKEFGGVIPEYAARGHAEIIDSLVIESFKKANLQFNEIDAIAVTSGPGLIGGLIVGIVAAKAMASVLKKPLIAVNHLEAHALTARLVKNIEFPYLLALLSGGHCQILLAKNIGEYLKIGETIDDALGECFDKVGSMVGIPYPAGPKIEKTARLGDNNKYKFPLPLVRSENKYDFSFSGLKTAVKRQIEKITATPYQHDNSHEKLTKENIQDLCASFQKTVVEILKNRINNAISFLLAENLNISQLVIAGGVAANRHIYSEITNFLKEKNIDVFAPPINLCTDNAAMVAWVGLEKFCLGQISDVNFKPRAKWNLCDK